MATLSSLYGQDAAVGALRKGLGADQLAGAYLLVGAQGVGKMALALAFAQAAACMAPRHDPFDACGICDSCRLTANGTQPEIVTVVPASDQMQIWQFWDRDNRPPGILTHTLSYAPVIGHRRVYILDRAEALTEAAANSLLKVLEEPPPFGLFLLLAPHPARMLPTIVSRSQVIRLRTLPVDLLAAYLHDNVGIEVERAGMLAAYTEGRIGQAIGLARSPAAAEEIERIMALAEALAEAPRVRALRLAEQMRKAAAQTRAILGVETAAEAAEEEGGSTKERAGRRQLAAVFDLLVGFYRDLLALRVCGPGARIIHRDRAARLTRLSQMGSPERWIRCLDVLLLSRRRLDANANVSLVTDVLCMRLLAR